MTQRQLDVMRRLNAMGTRCSTYVASGRAVNSKPTYQALRQLEAKGLVDRQQNSYWPFWSLTPKGREYLAASVTAA